MKITHYLHNILQHIFCPFYISTGLEAAFGFSDFKSFNHDKKIYFR